MKKILLVVFLLVFNLIQSQETITNQSVIDLIDLGFDTEVVESKINSSPVKFDTSLKELKRLKSLWHLQRALTGLTMKSIVWKKW